MPRRKKTTFSALPGEHATHGEFGLVRIVDISRVNGVHGATVRPLDSEYSQLPGLGMRWVKMRDLSPAPGGLRGGVARAAAPSGAIRSAESTDLQGEKSSLQNEGKPATVRRRRNRSNQPTSNQRRTKMATATTGRKRGRTKTEAEPETKPKARGRKAAAKTEPEAKSNGNGNGNGRRTHEDILELVPEIVAKLKNGVTMTEIRAEYGAGPVIRKALTEKGYNTKGEKIEVEDISDLKGQRLAKAVAAMREDGKAWYYIELAADMSEDDLKDLLEENGYKELASGRVIVASAEEEEEAPKPTGRKKGRGAAKATEPEAEKPKARGRRRGRGNPSTED